MDDQETALALLSKINKGDVFLAGVLTQQEKRVVEHALRVYLVSATKEEN